MRNLHRLSVVNIFWAFLGGAVVMGPSAATLARQPNILILLADDQRPDSVAAYGNQHIRTPHIDSLARQGFCFRQNYCMGSMHGAVCQPSRAMLNSGRTLYRVPMDLAGVTILPELLRNHGYTTFGTGKWHNGEQSFLRGFEKGNAVFLGGMSNHRKVPIRDVTSDGTFSSQRDGKKFSSELFVDAAVQFLNRHDHDKPFYAYVAFTAPHDPRQPPRNFCQMYYDDRPPFWPLLGWRAPP